MTITGTEAYEAMCTHHQILSEQLRTRVAAVSEAVTAGRPHQAAVAGVIAFLADEVLPHAAAEEETIYPAAAEHAELIGTVNEMVTEHTALSTAAEALAGLADGTTAAGLADGTTAAEQADQIADLFAAHAARENDVLLRALLAADDVDLAALLAQMHSHLEEAARAVQAGEATTRDTLSDPSPQAVDDRRTGTDLGLADEHALLLMQVAARAEAVLAVAAEGRWPARELRALLGYLSAEVLRQAADEEQLLFPGRGDPAGLARLAGDHAQLRARIEALEYAASDGAGSPAGLASAVLDLVRQVEDHLSAEEAVLGAYGGRNAIPATSALGGRPHEWYSLTEGQVVDLDALPRGEVTNAAVDRVLRLRRGAQVELQSTSDLSPVWQRIDELTAGRYGFVYLEDGPRRWRLQVTRRESGGTTPEPAP